MENFVLYEELRQDNHSVMYKGRRRGTIEFVSIQCFEKCLRDQVTNSVRILHTFEHPNIIRFYEWYETDNHLWCIVELCTGGVLEDVIVQDGHLPEESILEFGLDLVTGLNYIHSMGVVLCELNSSKILLDNDGVLKYFDFSNAMLPGGHDGRGNDGGTNSDGSDEETTGNENVRQQARYGFSHDPQTGSEPVIGNLLYMAPEVVQGGECSTASDLWSFGCVLYELYYGVPPFSGQTFEEVLHRTLNEELREFPAVEGEHPSEQFQNLVSSLLIKDHTKRISWPQVISHPFWGDTLLPHSKRSVSVVTAIKSDVEAQDERPHTAPFVDNAIVKDATFTLSGARPQTALPVLKIPEQVVRSQHNEQCQQKEEALFQTDEPDLSSKDQKICDAVSDVRQLLFHSSDVTVLPIFGSSKIHKMPALKWDSKALPFAALEIDVCREMDSTEFDGQLIVIERALVTSSAAGEAPSHRSATNSARAASNALGTRGKLHIAAYLYHICQNTDLANHVVNSPLFAVLISMLKGSKVPLDLKCRLVMILGRLARYSTLISQDLDLSEVLTVLSDLLRDNFRNVELKLGLVAALGEFLFYVVSEEQREGKSLPQWKVPMLLYTLIIRCLKEGETAAAQHYAVKTIMNVASTGGKQCEVGCC